MTKVRRFWAVVAFLGMVAIVSSSLQGQQGKKATGGAITPQAKPAAPIIPVAEAIKSRFDASDVLVYQPLTGDSYVAAQLQPKLEPAKARPRDFVIMMSHAATQAGPSWIAGHQIAQGLIENVARASDRVCLWTFNTPEGTKQLTKDFLMPKDAAELVLLQNALKTYRNKEYPVGDTDLKNALNLAINSFEANKDRQRIIVFLGDGLSTHNPLDDKARLEIARQMVAKKIGFFPVPLANDPRNLDPKTLHGLANSTGGAVLRTRIAEEKLVDALKRYETAFDGPVLYNAKIELPAEITGVCPATLPPLRSDTPTLIVGRMKKGLKELSHTITGVQAGRKGEITIAATEQILPADLDNYFLVGMIDQWAKAKEYPATLQANRALVIAYEDTRLAYKNMNEEAGLALEQGQNGAARKIFEQIRRIAPHDTGADAGIKIIDKLENGTLTREALKKQLIKRTNKVDELRVIDGKPQWVNVNVVEVQNGEKAPAGGGAKKPAGDGGIGGENLIKEFRDRQAVEEQKFTQGVEDAIRRARRDLALDPDGNLDNLRTWLNRVKDHPDLGAQTRDALATRLQTALRDSAKDVQLIKIRKAAEAAGAAQVQANLTAEQERKTFIERVESQYRVYKDLIRVGRFEERTKMAIIDAMVAIQSDARVKGMDVPVSAKASYDIALAAYPVQQYQNLVRKREDKWLAAMMSVEKSHMPYPDEPRINFPPLATWKALSEARKDKYAVTTLPNDEQGIKTANKLYKMLQTPIDTTGLQEKVKLKTALELFSDKFQGNLPILVDKDAFLEGKADAPDVYEEEVQLPLVPKRMPMATALRLILAQVGGGKATYLIRREFVEVTTTDRYITDKVLRVYPVGDLVIPISNGQMGMAGGAGMMGGGVMGMMGGGQMMGMGGGMMMGGMGMAGMGGMPMGGMGMAGMGMGMGGMPMGGMGMAGMGMGMGGMPMGGMGMAGMGMGMGGMPMGGMGMGGGMMMGMPMGGMGMGGMGMGGMGMGGMPGGNFAGGSFQGSFNGSLGFQGATQAVGLIDIITRIVDPGNWNKPPVLQPFAMAGFGFPGGMGAGMFGMLGMVGMAGGGMIGAGPPADPTVVPPDPQTSNSIDFFPPALALIIRAPSRIHSSIEGGIVGGRTKPREGAWLNEIERKALARNNNKGGKVEVGGVNDKQAKEDAVILAAIKKREENIDPQKVWQEAFAKGGAGSGMVIATADFLFDAGEFKHAAEFLKANLRYGVVVRPWVFEALAVALEASNGSPEEIRQVRLSGIALDPNDAQGFLSAAKAMADRGEHDRALAFCRQAAILEPNDYHSYEAALTYAESGKDAKSMEWAVGKLVSQDWPVDNLAIQAGAHKRLESLASTLTKEKRGAEAANLKTALQRLDQRDLIVRLIWDNATATNPSELQMQIKEPSGSVCNLEQKQTPGGGIMIGYNLTDKEPNSHYVAAQALNGDYEITVERVYGQVLGNRARLEIIQNAGTEQQTRRLEIVRLDQKNTPIKVTLKNGRRTELATVSSAAAVRHKPVSAQAKNNAFNELRAVANPSYYGAIGPRGGAGTNMPSVPSVAEMASRDSKNKAPTPVAQNSINPVGGVPMTAQLRMSSDQRSLDMVIRPFFNSIGGGSSRPGVNLSTVPGGID
jgi:hypothetical protein